MKKKPAKNRESGSKPVHTRAKRIELGRKILKALNARIEEFEASKPPNSGGMFPRYNASATTKMKYEKEVLLEFEGEWSMSPDEVRLCLDLARFTNQVEQFENADVKEAWHSERLLVTQSDLARFLKVKDTDDMEKMLKERLKEQV